MAKVTVTYDPIYGEPVCDGEMLTKAHLLCRDGGWFVTSSERLIDAVRLEVAKGMIAPENVIFIYDGQRITVNEYGVLSNWPKGFCDLTFKLSEDILTVATRKRKEKNND